MSRLGLRMRVVLAAVLVLTTGVVIIGVAINVLLTVRLTADARAVLRARADAQATTIQVVGGRVRVREATGAEALDREAWVFAAGRQVARPAAPPDVQRVALALAAVTATTVRDVPSSTVRLLAEPVPTAEGRRERLVVVVGLTLKPYEETEQIARLGTFLLGLFVVLAGAAIASRSVRAGLRPVGEMARRAEDYSEHDLSGRFDMGPPRDELTGLASTLDGLLGRLEAGLRREQRLSAEIAHELRTPLSGVRAMAELGLADPDLENMRDSLRTVIASADRMNGVVDALLSSAHGPDASGATSLVDDVAAATVSALAAVAAEAGIGLHLELVDPGLVVGAEAHVVGQALSPLIENAIRHAQQRVTLAVRRSGPVARFAVQDDGPGIADADLTAIFEPGWRTPGGSGAGLGLALARRLASSLGGTVRAEPSSGGALMVLELPLIAAGASGSRADAQTPPPSGRSR